MNGIIHVLSIEHLTIADLFGFFHKPGTMEWYTRNRLINKPPDSWKLGFVSSRQCFEWSENVHCIKWNGVNWSARISKRVE